MKEINDEMPHSEDYYRLRDKMEAALESSVNRRPMFSEGHPSYTTLYNNCSSLKKEVEKLNLTIERQNIIIDRLTKTNAAIVLRLIEK